MKITVLIENTSESELKCEHGLSLLISQKHEKISEEHSILLDAGSTETFYENANALGIDLSNINTCVLSHGHYDHSGGFGVLLQKNPKAIIYAQKSAVDKYYSGSGGIHEIGIPENVLAYQERFCLIDGVKEIEKGIYLVPHHTAGLEKNGAKAKLYKMGQPYNEKEITDHHLIEQLVPDDFSHEQSLVYDTEKGLVIFNSCSHGGVENIIHEVKEYCGNKQIYAYIGGLHMKGRKNGQEICTFSDDEIDALCETIQKEQITYVYTGHCTGSVGLHKMQQRLREVVRVLTTGLEFEI